MLTTACSFADAGDAAGAGGTCSVDVVTDYRTFLNLEADWNDTVERAAIPHPFLRHEWVRTWWDCFGAGRDLHIMVVRSAGRIIAIAPLMSESARMYGLPVRQLRFVHNDHTPRADFIVAEQREDVYRAIWQAMQDSAEDWDLVLLNQVPADSPTHEILFAHAEEHDCPTGVWSSGESPYLELRDTWDAYYGSLPTKFRSNLRNRLSRLTQLGNPALELIEGGSHIMDACADAWRLEASGWKRDEGTAITSDAAVNRFYTMLTDRAADHGWLRLLFLTVGGRRIATSYGSVYRDRLFLFKTGYDPEYAKCSPFKLLTYFATQEAYAEGLCELDFLGDTEPWKLEWTTTTRAHEWLFIFANTNRGRLLHRAKFHLAPAIKRLRG